MTESHGQNSALNSTVKSLRHYKMFIFEKWHHFGGVGRVLTG